MPSFSGRDSIVGDRVKFTCRQSGATLKGPDFINCLPNGKWSLAPTCIQNNKTDAQLFGDEQKKSKKATELLHSFTQNT